MAEDTGISPRLTLAVPSPLPPLPPSPTPADYSEREVAEEDTSAEYCHPLSLFHAYAKAGLGEFVPGGIRLARSAKTPEVKKKDEKVENSTAKEDDPDVRKVDNANALPKNPEHVSTAPKKLQFRLKHFAQSSNSFVVGDKGVLGYVRFSEDEFYPRKIAAWVTADGATVNTLIASSHVRMIILSCDVRAKPVDGVVKITPESVDWNISASLMLGHYKYKTVLTNFLRHNQSALQVIALCNDLKGLRGPVFGDHEECEKLTIPNVGVILFAGRPVNINRIEQRWSIPAPAPYVKTPNFINQVLPLMAGKESFPLADFAQMQSPYIDLKPAANGCGRCPFGVNHHTYQRPSAWERIVDTVKLIDYDTILNALCVAIALMSCFLLFWSIIIVFRTRRSHKNNNSVLGSSAVSSTWQTSADPGSFLPGIGGFNDARSNIQLLLPSDWQNRAACGYSTPVYLMA